MKHHRPACDIMHENCKHGADIVLYIVDTFGPYHVYACSACAVVELADEDIKPHYYFSEAEALEAHVWHLGQ
jgi:hypothetical protein